MNTSVRREYGVAGGVLSTRV